MQVEEPKFNGPIPGWLLFDDKLSGRRCLEMLESRVKQLIFKLNTLSMNNDIRFL